ncbi:hypothetical protein L5515_005401 [Caenorhabditis briggsae]|uniref:KANL2-like probable zinc-finger domain-containing protein n=2 Tax=Caenorhabditis briggsae TaxID=6238 RepID=A0AAE9JE53_CAEBR|nr:hypothetical protein L5515_005401 [Caenorhabditis briggsae]
MKQATRPPAQYILAPGTQFRLVANEYDKNKYGQCNYVSFRTLIKCKQIRSKDDLARNGGQCEEHKELAKVLEQNHRKEVQRCHAENDSKMARRRFDPWIVSNDYISDDDDFLQAIQEVPVGTQEFANNSILDSHPLRYAGRFTEKDLLRIKMDLVRQDITDLEEFRRLLTAQAQKEHELMLMDEEDDDELPTDMAQRRVIRAAEKYGKLDDLVLTTTDPVFKPCCVGPEMDDQQVINHVIHSLLAKVCGSTPISVPEEKCKNAALPLNKFCIDHILLDRGQKLFGVCRECGATAIDGKKSRCSVHMITGEHARSDIRCACSRCIPEPSPRKIHSSRTSSSRASEINILDDDEGALGNLSRIESMASPMTQFGGLSSSHQSTSGGPPVRRYHGSPAQLLRPPQMGPPPGTVPYQKPRMGPREPQTMLTQQQLHEQHLQKIQEEEAKSLTCARVRPLDPNSYGEGKRKQEARRTPYTAAPRHPSTPYPHNIQRKTPTLVSPPGGNKMTFQGWKTHAASGTTPRGSTNYPGLGPTRYPQQQQRQPPQPKNIPLERVQEPKNPDELVEAESPAKYAPEPQRRGVPYYKNAYRKVDASPSQQQYRNPPPSLQPSTSTSSSQLLGPPQSPHGSPKMYRPPAGGRPLPMAPHRAIAAGLNPADVGGVSRSTQFRMQQPPHRLQRAPGAPQPTVIQSPPGATVPQTPPRPQATSTQGLPGIATVLHGPNKAAAPPAATVSQPATVTQGAPARRTTATTYRIQGPAIQRNAPGSTSTSSEASPRGSAAFHAVSALDSARHDSRFANINVRTFLSMGQMGQKDLSKMSQEELEQMAAETEISQEKIRKNTVPVAATTASTPRPIAQPPRTVTSRKPNPATGEIPESVWDVVATPSIVAPKKRKEPEETTSSGEPPAKKPMTTSSGEGSEGASDDVKSTVEQQPEAKPLETIIPAPTTQPSSTTTLLPSPSGRAPRAAAIAANQAMIQQSQKPVTPSTTTNSSSTSTSSAPLGQSDNNFLDLLAELAEAEEAGIRPGPLDAVPPPPRPPSTGNRKAPKRASGGQQSSTSSASAATSSTVSKRRASMEKKSKKSEERDLEPPAKK